MEFKGIPTFRITNYETAIEFYITFLGFTIDWESRRDNNPLYMQISKAGLILHLSENERFKTGAVVFVDTSGIDVFFEELQKRHGKYFSPAIEVTGWGTSQLEITDPFGNLLRFNQNKK